MAAPAKRTIFVGAVGHNLNAEDVARVGLNLVHVVSAPRTCSIHCWPGERNTIPVVLVCSCAFLSACCTEIPWRNTRCIGTVAQALDLGLKLPGPKDQQVQNRAARA